MIQEHDIHLGRNVRRSGDPIRFPIHAGHVAPVKHHFFHETAAEGLNQVCRDGAAQRIRIDDQPAVVGAHEAFYAHRSRAPG